MIVLTGDPLFALFLVAALHDREPQGEDGRPRP